MTQELVKTGSQAVAPTARLIPLVPFCDVYENDDELLVVADMPGVSGDGVDISLDKAELTLRGRRELRRAGSPLATEIRDCEYVRRFTIPGGTDRDRISAELKDGVLSVHLPKTDAVKPRQIAVRAG